MKTSIIALACVLLALCALLPAVAATTFNFGTTKFDNGTNLEFRIDVDEDLATEALQCTATFPGDLTWLGIRLTHYIYYPSNESIDFDVASNVEANGTNLYTGEVRFWNEGPVRNRTEITGYLLLSNQQKPGPFNFNLLCDIDGTPAYNSTLNTDLQNWPGSASGLSGFIFPLLAYLLF